MKDIPYEIQEQLYQCFRNCFFYKDDVEKFMVTCGVSTALAKKYKSEYKIINAKNVILELNDLPVNKKNQILMSMVTNFYYMETFSPRIENKRLAQKTINDLRNMVKKYGIIHKENSYNEYHIIQQDKKINKKIEKQEKILELRQRFYSQFSNSNPQSRGYELEKIIEELFDVNEISYKGAFRNEANTQQIDGYFELDGFSYLIEAKWVKNKINSESIASFKHKVESKLESTRGVFISINGFREEVLREYSFSSFNIIFINGEELTHVFEGRVELVELIKYKIQQASSVGNPNADISNILF